jgi:hypothetical protein
VVTHGDSCNCFEIWHMQVHACAIINIVVFTGRHCSLEGRGNTQHACNMQQQLTPQHTMLAAGSVLLPVSTSIPKFWN